MYILQICNTFSEVVLQETFEESHTIEHFIQSAMDWHEWFIYDDQKRALKGSYVKHSILKDGDDTIYKVFFNVRLAKTRRKYFINMIVLTGADARKGHRLFFHHQRSFKALTSNNMVEYCKKNDWIADPKFNKCMKTDLINNW